MKNMIYVTDPNQFDTMKYFQKYCFNCKRCEKFETRSFRKNHIKAHKTLLCQNCLNILWHGSVSPFSRSEIQQKVNKIKLERYGNSCVLKCKEIREKITSTNLKRYGFKCTLRDPKILCKAKRTMQERFGVDYALQNKEVYNKTQQTMLEKYKTTHVLQVKEFKEKVKRTCLNKFNNVSYFGSDKYFDDMRRMYGLNRSPSFKYNYYGIMFDSSWELAVWIYYIDHNIKIIREPIKLTYLDIKGISHDYYPDFYIEGIGYVEIKGDQFFDNNGNMINPYDSSLNNLYERKRKCAIENGVKIWRKEDICFYLNYCNKYHPRWDIIYCEDNYYNPSYWCLYYNNPIMYYVTRMMYNNSITPYNKIDNDGYIILDNTSNNKGITPYDIGRKR